MTWSPSHFRPPTWCGNFTTIKSFYLVWLPTLIPYDETVAIRACQSLMVLTLWCQVQSNLQGSYKQVQRGAKGERKRRRKWRRNLLKAIIQALWLACHTHMISFFLLYIPLDTNSIPFLIRHPTDICYLAPCELAGTPLKPSL